MREGVESINAARRNIDDARDLISQVTVPQTDVDIDIQLGDYSDLENFIKAIKALDKLSEIEWPTFEPATPPYFEDPTCARPQITVNDREIIIGANTYPCITPAEDAVGKMRSQKDKHYPAILSGDLVLVAPINITRTEALALLSLNSRTIGVFSLTSGQAKSLCDSLGGATRMDHARGIGYWNHWHSSKHPESHSWFAEKG